MHWTTCFPDISSRRLVVAATIATDRSFTSKARPSVLKVVSLLQCRSMSYYNKSCLASSLLSRAIRNKWFLSTVTANQSEGGHLKATDESLVSRVKDAELSVAFSFFFFFFFFFCILSYLFTFRRIRKMNWSSPDSGSFSVFLSAEERQARVVSRIRSYELFQAIHPRARAHAQAVTRIFEQKSTCAPEKCSFFYLFFFYFFYLFSIFCVQAVQVGKVSFLFFLSFLGTCSWPLAPSLSVSFSLSLSLSLFFFFPFSSFFKDSLRFLQKYRYVLLCSFCIFCKMRILTTRSPPPHTLIMPAQGEYRLTSRTLLQEGNACKQKRVSCIKVSSLHRRCNLL